MLVQDCPTPLSPFQDCVLGMQKVAENAVLTSGIVCARGLTWASHFGETAESLAAAFNNGRRLGQGGFGCVCKGFVGSYLLALKVCTLCHRVTSNEPLQVHLGLSCCRCLFCSVRHHWVGDAMNFTLPLCLQRVVTTTCPSCDWVTLPGKEKVLPLRNIVAEFALGAESDCSHIMKTYFMECHHLPSATTGPAKHLVEVHLGLELAEGGMQFARFVRVH